MCAARNPTTLSRTETAHRSPKRPRLLACDMAHDRRACARLPLGLPVRLVAVDGQAEKQPMMLEMCDIGTNGAYCLTPKWIGVGTRIELEVGLVDQPLGRGSLHMTSTARVVRADPEKRPGLHGLALAFDGIRFDGAVTIGAPRRIA